MTIRNSLRWVGLSQVTRICTQLISVTVLARLLSPADYGLMAIATVFVNLANLFRDFGTGAALIQRKEISEDLSNSVFWMNLFLGMTLFIILLGIAPIAAAFYHEPALQAILSLLALSFPIMCASIVPGALFERESNFRVVSSIEMFGTAVGLATALTGAALGWGVYALVAQTLAAMTVQSLLLFWKSTWRPTRRPSFKALGDIIGFSTHLSTFQFVNYFARNSDSFIIGKVLGASPLGLYSIAYRVMLFPVQNMSSVASRALYPIMSREHGRGASIAPSYLKSLGSIAFVTAPMMAVLCVFREPLVTIVFGNKWAGVTTLLAWLAPTGFIQSTLSTTGSVLLATGNTRLMFKSGMISSTILVASFLIGVQFGLTGLVIAYFVANVLNALFLYTIMLRVINASARDLTGTLIYPIVGSLAAGLVATLFDQTLGLSLGVPALVRMALGMCCYGVVYLVGAYLFARRGLHLLLSLVVPKFRNAG